MSYQPERYTESAVIPAQANIMHTERAGDQARDRVIDHLNALYSQGYMKQEELQARTSAAHDAVTTAQLRELFTDLPPLPEIRPPESWASLHRESVRYSVHAAIAFVSVLGMVGVPVFNSAMFHGFANGGPFVLAGNLLAPILGFISAVADVISFCIWMDEKSRKSRKNR